MHLAVGQGDLLTDPLQMAVAYSTLANAYMNERRRHGRDARTSGMEIDERQRRPGAEPARSRPRATCTSTTPTSSLVMEGIHEAASQPGGTSADVWAGWDQAAEPGVRKDGHGAARRARKTSPGTCATSATRRSGRL